MKRFGRVLLTVFRVAWNMLVAVALFAGLHADLPDLVQGDVTAIVVAFFGHILGTISWLLIEHTIPVVAIVVLLAWYWWVVVDKPSARERRIYHRLRVRTAKGNGHRPARSNHVKSRRTKRRRQQGRKPGRR